MKQTKITQTLWVNNAMPAALDTAKHMAGESSQDFFPNVCLLFLQSLVFKKKMRLARILDPCVYLLIYL